LRILVEIFHVGVCWRAIQVKVILLHILAVIALAIGETEQAFFQDWIISVPKRQRETEALMVIANSGEAILAPVISARSGLIVREVSPGVAILAVIFTHRAPLTLA